MKIIQKQIRVNKKRILMGIMILSMLNCVAGFQRMLVPDIPKFSEQSRSPDSSNLYITNFVYTFTNRVNLKSETMTHVEYEAKMQGILVSYLGARGFYKTVQFGKPPMGTKEPYVTAEINIESLIDSW